MDGENKKPSINVYQSREGLKYWFSKWLGVIVGVFGMIGAFLVSLLTNVQGGIDLKDKVTDLWFWVIWAVVFFIAIAVSIVTYRVSKRDAKNDSSFIATMKHYKEQKDSAMINIDLLPYFTSDKTKELYVTAEQDIVQDANLDYVRYKNGDYNLENLEDWQKKKLREISQIKIAKLKPRDLTHESSESKGNAYSLLPKDEKTAEMSYISSTMISRSVNTFAMLLVGSLAFSYSGWLSACINAIGILFAWGGSDLAGETFILNDLRSRYIAKADLLQEFNQTVDKYIKLHRKAIENEMIDDIKPKDDVGVTDEIKEPKKADFESEVKTNGTDNYK